MLTLAFRNTTPPATQRLALAPLAALASEPSSRRWLLRSSFLTEIMRGLRSAFKRRDAQRLVALLRAAADVAGGGGEEGRREVLRVGGGDLVRLLLEILASAGVGGDAARGDDSDSEDDVDVILAGTANAVFHPRLPVAALETLLLLRNLCFHPEAKAHVTAEPRAVDALVSAAGAADPGARAAAADALLALVHNGQRVAAQLRHGTRPARLRRAAGRAYRETQRASEEGSGPSRAEATAHASKCLAALVAVLGVSGGGADFKNGNHAKGASPDSTLLDIDEAEFGKAGEMCADGLALGPEWVYR
jgi:rotatin